MFYVGKEVKVKSGMYKGTVGKLSSLAGCHTYFSVLKDDGVKIKVHYKDILDVEVKPTAKQVGNLGLLRKSIKLNGKKQTFTLCEILDKELAKDMNIQGKKNNLGKVTVKTLTNEELVVNCNAVLGLAI